MEMIQSYDELYNKIESIGIAKSIAKSLLPSYYKKSNEQSAILQTALFLSDVLSLNLESLLSENKSTEFELPHVAYKHIKTTNELELKLSSAVIIPIVKKIVYTLNNKNFIIPENGTEIRDSILMNDKPYVDFYSLVEYCWRIGIPVIFVSSLPKKCKKMQGMSFFIDDRPVIVLTKNRTKSAWYLFTLAHELGHIIKKHVNKRNIAILDEHVSLNYQNTVDLDKSETEANDVALEILCGNKITAFRSRDNMEIKANDLAKEASGISKKLKIDPGFIVLNYAWNMTTSPFENRFSTAETALKILHDKDIDIEYLTTNLKENINLELLPDESVEHISKYIVI